MAEIHTPKFFDTTPFKGWSLVASPSAGFVLGDSLLMSWSHESWLPRLDPNGTWLCSLLDHLIWGGSCHVVKTLQQPHAGAQQTRSRGPSGPPERTNLEADPVAPAEPSGDGSPSPCRDCSRQELDGSSSRFKVLPNSWATETVIVRVCCSSHWVLQWCVTQQ